MKGKLVSSVTKLSKQKTITGTVIDVLGLLCSVRLSTRGGVLRSIKYIGPKPKSGDLVYIDYGTGVPVVKTTSENLEEQVAELSRSLTAAPDSSAAIPAGAPETPATSSGLSVGDEDAVSIPDVLELLFPEGTLTDLGEGSVRYEPGTVRRFYFSGAPDIDDDETLGYVGTDVWLDEVTKEVYILRDPTEGAADWLNIGSGSSTSFEPVTEEVEKELTAWYVDGSLAEIADASHTYLVTRYVTLGPAYIYCKDNGSSGQTIVDIHLNGVTIFTDQGNRPELDSSTVSAISGAPDVIDLEPGDLLTIDIDDVAVGASGLTLVLTEVFFEILFDEDGEIIVEEE